ncbi:NAD(P)/FAD-dependent oxidoreductase [Sphingomonas canadensis]|uniref:NAD(P)/FAD-dependent oxidoreductase n=1 Tax=Sphingomonas canadensis TaxID=1219257 RepID=A0ABW3H9M8_9SPHN|nr:FAD-dependent oxidoreductase [Sphingomonas canadensis]MCW3836075.1 FAD-binding oxidoreductase [Sphingomonas canadensis]
MSGFDFAIIGAGIAGAGIAAELAPHARVLILEGEDHPGYHTTGRSAAFWSETYGGPLIQPLTTASTEGISPFLEPLGSYHIARFDEQAIVDKYLADFANSGVELIPVDPRPHIPGLREQWSLSVYEPSCAYIDVGGLHGAFLKAARAAGAELRTGARLTGVAREGGRWRLATSAGDFAADVLVDAAGAWADPVAEMAGARPIGIQPYRRTMVQILTDPPPPEKLTHVGHLGGSFYFKPEAGGRLWLSPHDEIPSPPCDAQPEDIDVAIAIDRFEHCVDWRVAKLEHKWAGLRSFAPDRLPVYGFDPDVPGFFWCAGQGGFGIQTAPAASKMAAALALGGALPDSLSGIDPNRYSAARFRASVTPDS